jgi:hypothetical protein
LVRAEGAEGKRKEEMRWFVVHVSKLSTSHAKLGSIPDRGMPGEEFIAISAPVGYTIYIAPAHHWFAGASSFLALREPADDPPPPDL